MLITEVLEVHSLASGRAGKGSEVTKKRNELQESYEVKEIFFFFFERKKLTGECQESTGSEQTRGAAVWIIVE